MIREIKRSWPPLIGPENSSGMDAKSGWFRHSDAKVSPNKIHMFDPDIFDLADLSLEEYPKWSTASVKLHRAKRQNRWT